MTMLYCTFYIMAWMEVHGLGHFVEGHKLHSVFIMILYKVPFIMVLVIQWDIVSVCVFFLLALIQSIFSELIGSSKCNDSIYDQNITPGLLGLDC